MELKNDRIMKQQNPEENDNKKELPTLYNAKEECCGCTACKMSCPVKAINMLEDEEGFLYPVVDATICIRCYKCMKVCPLKE